jgi:transcriptional regulator with XRE-family HTH domain
MIRTPFEDLVERLKNTEFAKLYGEEDAKLDFAITLTKARRSLNLTQKELALKLNISQPYIAKLEGGEANPTLGTIGKLLATINLRLVTGTAPLAPEPVSPQIVIKASSSGLQAAEDIAAKAWKSYSNAAGPIDRKEVTA